EYAGVVIDAIGDAHDLIIVAQSLGAFTAVLVCSRVPADLLVLVAPMIPAPREAPADYWTDTRYADDVDAHYEDAIELFYQDVPKSLAAQAMQNGRRQSETRLHEPP